MMLSPYDPIFLLHQDEVERMRQAPPSQTEQPNEALDDLPDAAANCPVTAEWNLFRQEVGRLIREGAQGRFALVKVGQPVTVWDTARDAVQAAGMLYGQALCLVQEIRPALRSYRPGRDVPCPS